MTKVTEHDSKEEREGDDDGKSGVDLAVGGGSVRVDDDLEGLGELVRLQVGRRGLVCADLVDDRGHRQAGSVVHVLERRADERKVVGGAPTLGNQSASGAVVREEVERVVDSLLLADQDHPSRQRLGDLGELGVERLLRISQNVLDVIETGVHLVNLIPPEVAVLIDVVDLGPHGLGDLANLGQDLLSVREDDEDILLHRFVVAGVDQRLRDL